jgi:hypothetical protein
LNKSRLLVVQTGSQAWFDQSAFVTPAARAARRLQHAFRLDPAVIGGALFWGLNPIMACLDRRIVRP